MFAHGLEELFTKVRELHEAWILIFQTNPAIYPESCGIFLLIPDWSYNLCVEIIEKRSIESLEGLKFMQDLNSLMTKANFKSSCFTVILQEYHNQLEFLDDSEYIIVLIDSPNTFFETPQSIFDDLRRVPIPEIIRSNSDSDGNVFDLIKQKLSTVGFEKGMNYDQFQSTISDDDFTFYSAQISIIPSVSANLRCHQESRFHLVSTEVASPSNSRTVVSHVASKWKIVVSKFMLFLLKNIFSDHSNLYITGPSGIGKSISLLFVATFLNVAEPGCHVIYFPDAVVLAANATAEEIICEELIYSIKSDALRNFLLLNFYQKTYNLEIILRIVMKYLEEHNEKAVINSLKPGGWRPLVLLEELGIFTNPMVKFIFCASADNEGDLFMQFKPILVYPKKIILTRALTQNEFSQIPVFNFPDRDVAENLAANIDDLLILDNTTTGLNKHNPEYWKKTENVEKAVGVNFQKVLREIKYKFRSFSQAHSEEKSLLNATREMLLRLPATSNVKLDKRFMIELWGPSHKHLLNSDVGWGPGRTFAFEAEQIFSKFTERHVKYILPTNKYVEIALSDFLMVSGLEELNSYLSDYLLGFFIEQGILTVVNAVSFFALHFNLFEAYSDVASRNFQEKKSFFYSAEFFSRFLISDNEPNTRTKFFHYDSYSILLQPTNYRSVDFIIVDIQRQFYIGIKVSASDDSGHFWKCLDYQSDLEGVSKAEFRKLWMDKLPSRRSHKFMGIGDQHKKKLEKYHKSCRENDDFRDTFDSQSWSFFFIYFCPRNIVDKIIASKEQMMKKPIGIVQDTRNTSVRGKRKMPEPEETVGESPSEGERKMSEIEETVEESPIEEKKKMVEYKELDSATLIWDASFLASFEDNLCFYDFLKVLPSDG